MGQRGSVYRHPKSRFWYIAFRGTDGKRIIESSCCERKEDALDILNDKLAKVAKGIPITKKTGKIELKAALQLHIDDLTANGKPTADAKQRHKALLKYLGETRVLASIGLTDLRAFVAHRLGEGYARASVNRELAALKRAYRLARESEDVVSVPKFPMLTENNARKGFFERDQFEAVREHLPEYLRPVVTLGYWTGWRTRSELLPLTTDRVDSVTGVVRLDVGETKSGEGREFYYSAIPELKELFTNQLADIERLKTEDVICAHVFHTSDGKPIKSFYGSWRAACDAAGYPGMHLHDFRRTACRNLNRAGVPQTTAMAMVGHKTPSIYKRYSIKDGKMLREGSEQLAAWATGESGKAKRGKVKKFEKRSA